MKLINQSFEIINQTDFSLKGILKHIERCARVSYKSEQNITEDSYKKFTDMLIARGHDRPLEFGTVHLKMDFNSYDLMTDTLVNKDILNQLWIKEVHKCGNVYITTNYRYYLTIKEVYSDIERFFTEEDNKYFSKRYTVHMILSRGVMDEFRTHVGLSHLAESTRYCNYSKGKFGGELTFIKPNWTNLKEGEYTWKKYFGDRFTDTSSPINDQYMSQLFSSEESYLELLKQDCKPQEAREVLPLAVKSELISCGFADVWENFFYRRDAPDAHPMAQQIAKPLHQEFIKLGYSNKIN